MNPAQRLHEVLVELKSMPNNPQLRKAISTLFNINDPDSPEVFRSFVKIINLAWDVNERIHSIPNLNKELYLRSIESILAALATCNLEHDLNQLGKNLKPECLHGLEFISDVLENIESEDDIPEEDLKNFEQRLEQLIEDIREARLEADFTHFLISHLFLIRTSIQNYRFFGSTGVRASLARVTGEIILDPREGTTDEKRKGFLKKTIATIKDINSVLVFVRNGSKVVNRLAVPEWLQLG